MNLQNSPPVRHDMRIWTDARRSALLQKEIIDSVQVSEHEIAKYYERNSRKFGVETEINLREILCATDSAARSLRERILRGEDMAALARRHTLREEWKMNDGVSGFLPASTHPDLAFHAVVADSGVLVGPFKLEGGYSIFKVLGIRHIDAAVLDRLPEIREQIRGQLFELKTRRKMDNFISDCAGRDSVVVREGSLRAIKATPTNMMTWRYIGFGGRINAVPMLIEQTGWVDRWRGLTEQKKKGDVLP